MLLIAGVTGKTGNQGPGATRTCPRCGNTTQWQRLKSYRQFTLFFVLPLWRWGRQEYEQCGVCGQTAAA